VTTESGLLPASPRVIAAGRYLRLTKPKVAALCTLSAAAGFSLAARQPTVRILPSLAGLFLLACGSAALNQCQERELDARMSRTRRRPLPAGEVRPRGALLFSICLMLPGLVLLQRGGGAVAALLGLAAALWYNGVYTLLKKKSAFAFIPGALVGAVPPAIGWVSAGGGLGDPRCAALCGFLFLWQVPHFGLLVLSHGAEYAGAGLPVLTDVIPGRRLRGLILLGVLGTAAVGLLLPLSGGAPSRVLLAAATAALAAAAGSLVGARPAAPKRLFVAINGYMLLVLAIAVVAGFRR
jgi:protoheme IX farnesyltransferase